MIVDDDGEYIAGTMRCFARVALAGLVAASSLAAQLPGPNGWHQDSPSQALEDSHVIPWVQHAPPVVWAATAIFDDDSAFAPGAVSFALDEGQWTVTVPPPLRVVQPVTDDDQFVSAATFFTERYEWPVVVGPPVVPRIVQAVTDDDQYIGYLGTDEDGQWRFVISASPLVQAVTDDSDFVVVAPSALEHGEWSPVVPLVPPRVVQAVADDDQYVGYLGTDEDGWLAPVPARTSPVVALTDDDQFVTSAAATFFVERYQWPLYTVPITTASVVAVTDDDQFVGTQPFVLVQGSVGSGAWIPFAHARSLKITRRDILRAKKRRRVPVVVVETPAIVALAPPLVGRAWETAPAPVSLARLVPTPLGLRLNTASPAFGSGKQHAVAAPAPVDALVAIHESDDDLIHAIALLL